MAILLIDSKVKADIARALDKARQKPVPLAVVRQGFADSRTHIALADRPKGFERPRAQEVLIPVGYRAAVSVEQQPSGMYLHLSVSVERPEAKWTPSPESVAMIAQAFGIDLPITPDRGQMWMEEYEPGRHAVNLLVLLGQRIEAGHA